MICAVCGKAFCFAHGKIVESPKVESQTPKVEEKKIEVAEIIPQQPKKDISKLFLAAPAKDLTPATAEEIRDLNSQPAAIHSPKTPDLVLDMVVNETVNRDSASLPYSKQIILPSSDAVEINRPKTIIEIANDNNILTPNEIASIDCARNNTIDGVFKNMDAQGPITDESGMVIKSLYDRKEEYLTNHIRELKIKMAQLKVAAMTANNRRSRLRLEEIEKLTPEELEDFKARAKKSAGSKNILSADEKNKKRAKADALKAISKEKRAAAKMLTDSGEKAIPACIMFYGLTEEQCKRFIDEGEF